MLSIATMIILTKHTPCVAQNTTNIITNDKFIKVASLEEKEMHYSSGSNGPHAVQFVTKHFECMYFLEIAVQTDDRYLKLMLTFIKEMSPSHGFL